MRQTTIKQFFSDEDGQALVEYGLLTGILALSILIGLRAVSVRTSNVFNSVANSIRTTT